MAKSSDLPPCSKCSKSCCCTAQYAVTLFSPRPFFSLVSSYGSFFLSLRMSAGQLLRGGAGLRHVSKFLIRPL